MNVPYIMTVVLNIKMQIVVCQIIAVYHNIYFHIFYYTCYYTSAPKERRYTILPLYFCVSVCTSVHNKVSSKRFQPLFSADAWNSVHSLFRYAIYLDPFFETIRRSFSSKNKRLWLFFAKLLNKVSFKISQLQFVTINHRCLKF